MSAWWARAGMVSSKCLLAKWFKSHFMAMVYVSLKPCILLFSERRKHIFPRFSLNAIDPSWPDNVWFADLKKANFIISLFLKHAMWQNI